MAAAAFVAAACAPHSPAFDPAVVNGIEDYEPPSVSRRGGEAGFDTMIETMRSARAVVVGEAHDRFDHHLNQLAIIEGLHRAGANLAIGMEQFQQPFQDDLDDYIKGSIGTETMLIRTEYFERWRYDYRLYEPILTYAREHRIPVVALNVPTELTRKVAAGGLEALNDDEAARLPSLDRSDERYRRRLREVFDRHPDSARASSFENFYTVQLLWDEGMAARAAGYLNSHPNETMVVLAGQGHVEFGSGIPDRLRRRIQEDVVTVVPGGHGSKRDERADYILFSDPVQLPDKGMLGVTIDPRADGARIDGLRDDGAAKAAGVQIGDVITAVDGQSVGGLAELKARLWNKRPGDPAAVTIRRQAGATLQLKLTLR